MIRLKVLSEFKCADFTCPECTRNMLTFHLDKTHLVSKIPSSLIGAVSEGSSVATAWPEELSINFKISKDRVHYVRDANNWAKKQIIGVMEGEYYQLGNKGWMAYQRRGSAQFEVFCLVTAVQEACLSLLKEYLVQSVPPREGLFLHSAALVAEGKGILFLGPSGAGKTTLAKKAKMEELEVLSDELTFLRRTEAGYELHGLPFGNVQNSARIAPLHGIYFLEKDRVTKIVPLPTRIAVGKAWADTIYRKDLLTPAAKARLFEAYHELFRTIPVFTLARPKSFCDFSRLLDSSKEPAGGS